MDTAGDDTTEMLVNEADHLWTAAAQLLRAQVSEAVWLSTFQDTRAERLDSERLVLVVPSSHVRDRIEGRYLALVRDALLEIGRPELDLEMEVNSEPRLRGPAGAISLPVPTFERVRRARRARPPTA